MGQKNLIILIIILLPMIIFFHTRGIVFGDEGYILHSSERILDGQLPYRDFSFIFTPGSIFLTALSLKILGTSILSSRLLMVAVSILTIILIYKCIHLPTRNKVYATIASLIYAAWLPTHLNFSWPTSFALSSAFLSCYFVLKFLETRKVKYLSLFGFTVFSVFIMHQGIGLATIISSILFFVPKSSRNVLYHIHFLSGTAWGAILFLSYLLLTDSFAQFFSNFSFNPTTDIFMTAEKLNPIYFFFVPIITSASIILLYIRRRFHLLFIPAIILTCFIIETQSSPNPFRLLPFIALSGVPLALYIRYNISSTVRALLFLLMFLLVGGGFITGLVKDYYKSEIPLRNNTLFSPHPRIFVFTTPEDQRIIKALRESAMNDYIYVDSFDPLIYFISSKKDPMQDSYLTIWDGPTQYYNEVQGNLVAKEVGTLVLRKSTLNYLPIREYVTNHYDYKNSVENFDIYTRTR